MKKHRTDKELIDLIGNDSWCDQCNVPDLGYLGANIERIKNKIYIVGKCPICKGSISTEIIESRLTGR